MVGVNLHGINEHLQYPADSDFAKLPQAEAEEIAQAVRQAARQGLADLRCEVGLVLGETNDALFSNSR
jgi:hypothetical protein